MPHPTYAKSTSLCLSCLKTAHTLTCNCSGGVVNLGRKKVAELVSQAQGDRNKILKIFDDPRLQHPHWQLVRMQIYLAGLQEGKTVSLGPAQWQKRLQAGQGCEIVHKPFCSGESVRHERYLIQGCVKHPVTIAPAR